MVVSGFWGSFLLAFAKYNHLTPAGPGQGFRQSG